MFRSRTMQSWFPVNNSRDHAYTVNRSLVKFRFPSRLYSTSIETQPSAHKHPVKRGPRCPHWRIRTLDPSRLSPSDFTTLSLKKTGTFKIMFETPGQKPHLARGILIYYEKNRVRDPFPPGTQGFLYYHRPYDSSPAAGSVRFRVTTSPNPTTFESGTDLLLPTGIPWKIPVPIIAGAGAIARSLDSRSRLGPLRRFLLMDQLVTTTELKTCTISDYTKSSQVVQSFDDHFFIRFHRRSHRVFAVVNGVKQRLQFEYLFWRSGLPHYSGTAICRFEPSNLPLHKGTRTVVVRIVKMVSPAQRLVLDSMVPEPAEGNLVIKPDYSRKAVPWSVNVDEIPHTALRMLFPDGGATPI